MLAELGNMMQTFEMYARYIDDLKLLGASAPEEADNFEQWYRKHKSSTALLRDIDTGEATQTLRGDSSKERNRIHAQHCRHRKSIFWERMTAECDASLLTLKAVLTHTTSLESSCHLLNDFGDATTFLSFAQLRQTLLQRARVHDEQYEHLKSRLVYRIASDSICVVGKGQAFLICIPCESSSSPKPHRACVIQ
jgi:hypothetical protein